MHIMIQLQINTLWKNICINYVRCDMIANEYVISAYELCTSWYDCKWVRNIHTPMLLKCIQCICSDI